MNILRTRICFDLLKITEGEISYSESEPDSNFAINLASNFDSFSELILNLNRILVQCLLI